MLERPLALLVDLDDTIVSDSIRAPENWRLAVESAAGDGALARRLLEAIDRERAWYWSDPERHRVGRADLAAARRTIVAAAVRSLRQADGGLVERVVEAYGRRTEEDRALLPGAIEALEEIRDLGIRLALVTNGAQVPQRAKIERFGLARLFEAIAIEGELGRGKPEPDVYRFALSALGVLPAQAWMVGDHLDWDVSAPQRLGLRGVWIDPRGAGLAPDAGVRPDLIVPDLPALAAALRALPAAASR